MNPTLADTLGTLPGAASSATGDLSSQLGTLPSATQAAESQKIIGMSHGARQQQQASDQANTFGTIAKQTFTQPIKNIANAVTQGWNEGAVPQVSTPDNTFGNSLASTYADAGNKIIDAASGVFDSHKSALEKGVGVGEGAMGFINALFAPITAATKTAATIPGPAGYLAGKVNQLFSALGGGGSEVLSEAVDGLPVSSKTKETIRPLAKEVGAFGVQILAGKLGGDVYSKFADRTKAITTALSEDPVMQAHEIPQSSIHESPNEPAIKTPTPDNSYTRLISQAEKDHLDQTGELPANHDNETLLANPGKSDKILGVAPDKEYRVTFNKSVEGKITSEDKVQSSVTGNIEKEHIASVEKISQLENKTAIPEQTKETPNEALTTEVPPREEGVTKTASDINQNLVKAGFDALPKEEQASFEHGSYKDTMDKVTEMMNKNIEDVKKMATGKMDIPSDVKHPEILFNAVEQLAMKNNDGALMRELAKSPISKTSEAGATLGSHGYNDNPNSAVAKIKEITNLREKRAAKNTKGKSGEKAKSDIKNSVKEKVKIAKPNKYDLANLLDKIAC